MRFWRGLRQPWRYAALFAGAVPVFAFPGTDFEFLAWFGLIPAILILRAAPTAREAAIRGWWSGAGYLSAALYWLIPNLGPGLLLVVIVLGVPWAGFGYAAWHLLRPQPASAASAAARGSRPVLRALAAMTVLPSCWVVIELLRSWQGIGGPWAVFGASQWLHPVVLSLAAVGGIWLISFVLVLSNTGLAIALTAPSVTARLAGALGTALAVAAGPVAFALLPAPPAARGPAATGPSRITIALVQPGLTHSPPRTIAEQERLTRQVKGADLIVWGESSVAYDLTRDPALLTRLSELAATTPLLANSDSLNAAGQKSKTSVLIGPGGIEARYVKTRLVPFGEYIPFRSVLGWLTKISRAAPVNMITGDGAKVLRVAPPSAPPFSFGVLICFESAFPDMSRADSDHGAQVLIYQTSDSTFQGSWAPEQHASLAALRAAETGRPAVQAALTGDTSAFDARGRLLAWAGTGFQGVTTVRLTLTASAYLTPFDQLGDYVPWFSLAVAGLALAYRIFRGNPETTRRRFGVTGHATASSSR